MKRIGVVAYTYYLSDPRVQREAKALAERGDTVDLICLREKKEKPFEIVNGVSLYRLPQGRYRGSGVFAYIMGYFLFFIHSFLKLNSLYFRRKYNLIHINTMPDFLVFAALIPKIFGVKVILDIHDTTPELYATKFKLSENHWIIKLIKFQEVISAKFANAVIAVHHLHKKLLVQHGISASKITILMNVADEKIFYPRKKEDKNKIDFSLIYHGTIAKRLGIDIAVKAVNILKDKIPNIKLRIYGEGDFLEELLELTKELNLEKYIYFSKGFFPVDKLPQLIKQADIGIVSTRDDQCTTYMLPVKLLEYVAMGIPVVVSRIKTVEAYFDDSMVKFFEPNDKKDAAEAIFELYSHPEKRKQLVDNANRFSQKYNWRQQKQIYYGLIDKLVS